MGEMTRNSDLVEFGIDEFAKSEKSEVVESEKPKKSKKKELPSE